MNRKKARNDLEKYFFKLMKNAVFRRTMENVRQHRDIKLVTTEIRRNHLVSEINYHTETLFAENLLEIEKKNRDTYEKTCLFRTFNTRMKQNNNVRVLV